MRQTLAERFWSRVDKLGPTDCWNWSGYTNANGYGQFSIKGHILAHRASWIINIGPLPEGEGWHGTCVLHHCDNPACVNPDHLFIGSNQDNVDDMNRKGRAVHPPTYRGESHPLSKVTECAVMQIRKYYAAGGCTQKWLASIYGVNHTQISAIVNRKVWRHI